MSRLLHFTIAENDRMIAEGIFDPRRTRRLELIRGVIRVKVAVGPMREAGNRVMAVVQINAKSRAKNGKTKRYSQWGIRFSGRARPGKGLAGR